MHGWMHSNLLRYKIIEFFSSLLMNRGAMEYIPPGVVRLIAPMFNLTTKDYESFHTFGEMFPASHFPPSGGLVLVDEEVDGVVYGDGTFIGPDKTRVLQRYLMAKFAARDEMLAALKFIQTSTVPQATLLSSVAQMLNQHFLWGVRAHQGSLLALYVRARGRSARDLETLLRNRGLSSLESFLQNFASRSGGNTNPSMFGREYEKLSANGPEVLLTGP
jgi:hypothetical protein